MAIAPTTADTPAAPTIQEATVFNIQKFSLDDGPGIRTVIFLKGCPLRCAWCANPESQVATPDLQWKADRCVGCHRCTSACSALSFETRAGAERLVMARGVSVDQALREELTHRCPGEALSFTGEVMDAETVVAEAMKDKAFYDTSGGGVTFSGGEVLLWSDFVVRCAQLLHGQGVSVAVETTGHGRPEDFEKLLDAVDLVLFDVKHWDSEVHRAGTAQPLDLIEKNLARALASDTEVLCRTPVIPGFNIDDVADPASVEATARGFADYLDAVVPEGRQVRLQLLPFHQFGEAKYDLLGRDYGLAGQPSLHHEDLEPLARALEARGIDAFL